MPKEIVWSEDAVQDMISIFDFWKSLTGSNKVGAKIRVSIDETIRLVALFPMMGKKSKYAEVSYVVKGDYIIYYQSSKKEIVIVKIYPCKKDPERIDKYFQ